jgi:hypothetical protein
MDHLRWRKNLRNFKICFGTCPTVSFFRTGSLDVGDAPASKSHQALERIEYISVVQKGQDVEEHDIWVLRDKNIDHIRKSNEY